MLLGVERRVRDLARLVVGDRDRQRGAGRARLRRAPTSSPHAAASRSAERDVPAETHSHRGPSTRDEVERVVREQLVEILGVDPDAVTLDTRLREDLDADDFALIDLVEARRGRARRAHGRALDRRRRPRRAAHRARRGRVRASPACDRRRRVVSRSSNVASLDSVSTALEATHRASAFDDRDAAAAVARAPVVVRGERRAGVERAARVPRRLRARSRRHALRVRALPAAARRPALRGARRRRERARARRARASSSTSARTCCSARARTRPAAAPSSRSSPTRSRPSSPRCISIRASRSRATSSCAACRDRIADAAAGPGGRDYKTRLQEAHRGPRRSGARATSSATRARITPSSSSRRCYVNDAVRRGRRASKKQAEQAAAWVAWTRLQDEAAGSRGATMPELPEVEVLRRDLEKEVVGKKIKSVEVTGTRSVRRHKNKKEFIGAARGPQDRVGAAPREVPRDRGSTAPRRSIVHLGMSGQLLRGEDRAREGAEAHARRDPRSRRAGLLRFVDPRTFGEMFVDEVRRPRRAGRGARAPRARSARDRDVVGPVRPHARRASTTRLKSLLMDQKFIAGHRQRLQRRDPLPGRAASGTA